MPTTISDRSAIRWVSPGLFEGKSAVVSLFAAGLSKVLEGPARPPWAGFSYPPFACFQNRLCPPVRHAPGGP